MVRAMPSPRFLPLVGEPQIYSNRCAKPIFKRENYFMTKSGWYKFYILNPSRQVRYYAIQVIDEGGLE